MHWHILAYRAPQQPSTARAAVWRLLKGAGAIYLQQSVCILPAVPGVAEALARAKRVVEDAGGSSTLLECNGLGRAGEREVRELFAEARALEYAELIERCGALETELGREIARGNLTFAEVEENEDELTKLRAWLVKIVARDFFGSPMRREAKGAVRQAAATLSRFRDRVLVAEGVRARPRRDRTRA